MTPTHEAAARLLWQHRRAGTVLEALPEPLRPTRPAEGHAIQACLPAAAGERVIGWKIAATSAAGQAHIGVDGPLAGRVLESFVVAEGAGCPLTGNRMRVVEPEFAFRIGRDLPPRATPYGQEEVLAAVASLHPALEVPDSRFADFVRAGKPQLIADDACCGVFRFGAAAPEAWRTTDLSRHAVHAVVSSSDTHTPLRREGSGSMVLGDPRVALTWLVNELSALGVPLRAGAFVSTGTCMVPLAIAPGDRVEADYGALGRITLSFND